MSRLLPFGPAPETDVRSSRPLSLLAALAAAALAACAPGAITPGAGPVPAECPPVPQGTMLDIGVVDPTLRTEIRYHTASNFTGAPLPGYDVPRALLRPEAAAALLRAHARLRAEGLGIKVFDAYRPVRATLAMVAWAERSGNAWVVEQGYVARESGHNRGATVDLTLYRLDTGRELDMGTPFDTFSEAAHTANATGAVRENRMRLVRAMEGEGFANYDKEWWHFRLPGDHAPLDVPLGCFR